MSPGMQNSGKVKTIWRKKKKTKQWLSGAGMRGKCQLQRGTHYIDLTIIKRKSFQPQELVT